MCLIHQSAFCRCLTNNHSSRITWVFVDPLEISNFLCYSFFPHYCPKGILLQINPVIYSFSVLGKLSFNKLKDFNYIKPLCNEDNKLGLKKTQDIYPEGYIRWMFKTYIHLQREFHSLSNNLKERRISYRKNYLTTLIA